MDIEQRLKAAGIEPVTADVYRAYLLGQRHAATKYHPPIALPIITYKPTKEQTNDD